MALKARGMVCWSPDNGPRNGTSVCWQERLSCVVCKHSMRAGLCLDCMLASSRTITARRTNERCPVNHGLTYYPIRHGQREGSGSRNCSEIFVYGANERLAKAILHPLQDQPDSRRRRNNWRWSNQLPSTLWRRDHEVMPRSKYASKLLLRCMHIATTHPTNSLDFLPSSKSPSIHQSDCM